MSRLVTVRRAIADVRFRQNRVGAAVRSSPELQLLELLGAEIERLRQVPADRPREATTDGPPMLAVLVLHLDGLGDWRARRGDTAAEAVLHLVSARLSAQLRVGDRSFGLGADASGGACVLSNVSTLGAARSIAQRLRLHLGSPWRIGSARLILRASIGMAVGPVSETARLLDEASRALQGACRQPGGLLPFRGSGADSGVSAAGR